MFRMSNSTTSTPFEARNFWKLFLAPLCVTTIVGTLDTSQRLATSGRLSVRDITIRMGTCPPPCLAVSRGSIFKRKWRKGRTCNSNLSIFITTSLDKLQSNRKWIHTVFAHSVSSHNYGITSTPQFKHSIPRFFAAYPWRMPTTSSNFSC